MFIMLIILVCTHITSFLVRVNLGLPNHKWQERRAAIAKTVDDDLGDQFRPAMQTGPFYRLACLHQERLW